MDKLLINPRIANGAAIVIYAVRWFELLSNIKKAEFLLIS